MTDPFLNTMRAIANAKKLEIAAINAQRAAIQYTDLETRVATLMSGGTKKKTPPQYASVEFFLTRAEAMGHLQHRPTNSRNEKQPIVAGSNPGAKRIVVVIDERGREHTYHATKGWRRTGTYPVASSVSVLN